MEARVGNARPEEMATRAGDGEARGGEYLDCVERISGWGFEENQIWWF